jgi:predicted ribosomally synthesized peptide with nif11-like leader
MALEQAKRFLAHVEADPALQERLGQLKGRSALEGLCAIAAEHGFLFNVNDYRSAVAELAAGELGDEAIAQVQAELGLRDTPQ